MNGQFYSIIALLIALPIFIFTVQYLNYSDNMGDTVSERVVSDQINQLAHSIEVDTEKAMEVSGRRALLAATNDVLNSGEHLTDATENITTLMLKGVINGSESFLMLNNTLPNWSERIASKPVDFNVVLEYGNISIDNKDAFTIEVGMDVNLTVTDRLGMSKLKRINVRKYADISLSGLEDPMFPIETQGFIRRIIRKADPSYVNMKVVTGNSVNSSGSCTGTVTFNKSENDNTKILVTENLSGVVFSRHLGIILEDSDDLSSQVSCSVTGNGNAVSLVKDAIASGYDKLYIDDATDSAWSFPLSENIAERYYYAGEGPTFLQRLEGDYTPSSYGMYTFIYVPELQEQAFPISPYSRLAYRYFSDQGSCLQVENMDSWFGIDGTDAAGLNLDDLLTANACVVS